MPAEPDASASDPPGRCPGCGRPSAAAFRPFCSRGCRDRDLLNWLDGRYAVPAVETKPERATPPEDQEG
jgi:endogenous inhibitor of DNA gyrase (YacG/DUF329 family)